MPELLPGLIIREMDIPNEDALKPYLKSGAIPNCPASDATPISLTKWVSVLAT